MRTRAQGDAARRDRPHGDAGGRRATRRAADSVRAGSLPISVLTAGHRKNWMRAEPAARRDRTVRMTRAAAQGDAADSSRRAGISLEAAQWSDNPGKQMVWVRPKQRRRAGRRSSGKPARRVLPPRTPPYMPMLPLLCRVLQSSGPSRQRALKTSARRPPHASQPSSRSHRLAEAGCAAADCGASITRTWYGVGVGCAAAAARCASAPVSVPESVACG